MHARGRGLLTVVWTFACAPARSEAPVDPAGAAEPQRREGPSPKKRVLGRPKIDRASLTAADELTLYFSEPVTPTAGFDPRQFRLSVGMHYTDIGYSATYYYDLSDLSDLEESAPPVAFTRIEPLDDRTLRLVLGRALAADACDVEVSESEGASHESGGIFLHYQDREGSAIVDADGNRLKDIAAGWVLRGAEEAAYYGRQAHRLLALGPIRCAFAHRDAPSVDALASRSSFLRK
jgi:hypothetical protein